MPSYEMRLMSARAAAERQGGCLKVSQRKGAMRASFQNSDGVGSEVPL